MTVRARYKIEAGISSTSAEDRDLGNHLFESLADQENEGGSRKTRLPAAAVDQELTMCDIATARLLIVRTVAADVNDTPVEITVKRNTVGNEAIEVGPLPGTKEGYLLLTTVTGITALFASNPGAVDMDVTIIVAGD